MTPKPPPLNVGQDYERKYGFHDPEHYVFKSEKGLTREIVERISEMKQEPAWMRQFRLGALERFLKKPMPTWANTELLNQIRFDNIHYFLKATDKSSKDWAEVPEDIRKTYEKLGIPEAERKFLAGVTAQYESEVVYHSIREDLAKQGVLFTDMDSGLREHPEIVQRYVGTVIPPGDNKFAALNSAVWSGGSFIYVPKGIHVEIPLQAYFRINAENMGQFERTLIIADEGALVEYIEGCTAPVYSTDSLHSAVVELIALPHAKIRYTTIQNWSKNVYNLVTKRAVAYEGATVEWIDGNLGCLTGDSQVFLNPDGPVAIKDVQPGQKVYALDLNTMAPRGHRVIATRCTGIRPTYRLVTENYREIKATENHPFLTLTREPYSNLTQLAWRPLGALEAGDLIAIARGLPDEGRPYPLPHPAMRDNRTKYRPSLPAETNETLMWFLGLYLGDGCIERSREGHPRRVNFAVPPTDRARAKLERCLAELFKTPWKPKGISVAIGSSILAEWIVSIGFTGTASAKRIPPWVFTLPRAQKLAFIEGYLDADGCVRKHKTDGDREYGQLVFASCNRSLLEQMTLLMVSCGLNPLKIAEYVKERRLWKGRLKEYRAYYLSLNIRDNLRLIREKTGGQPGLAFVRVKTIEPLGEEPVFDIEVEGAQNFIANGIVVHNSKLTMKYPSIYLLGEHARGEVLSVAFAGKDQHQDAGSKIIHAAPHTTSTITSKSISRDGGRTTYRGLVKVYKGAVGVKSHVRCDALLMDERSRSDTYPTMEIDEEQVEIGHEASVSKVGEEQLFYLMSRGLKEAEATTMIVNGFFEPFAKELPLEYAVELNRLIQLEMEGSVG